MLPTTNQAESLPTLFHLKALDRACAQSVADVGVESSDHRTVWGDGAGGIVSCNLRFDRPHSKLAEPKSARSRMERRLAKYIQRLDRRRQQADESRVTSPATATVPNERASGTNQSNLTGASSAGSVESTREPFHDHVGDLIHGLRAWSMKLDLRESDLDRREQELNRRMRLMRQQQSCLDQP